MGNVVAKIRDFVGRDEHEIIEEHREENRRLLEDPHVLGDCSLEGVRRIEDITVAELDAAEARMRQETEMYCQEIAMLKQVIRERSVPILNGVNFHINDMSSVREFMAKRRGG